MRKMIWIAVVSVMLFACSEGKDDLSFLEGGQVFELTAIIKPTKGALARSRSSYSREAMQEVERVSIYVFQKNATDCVYLKTYNMPGWTEDNAFMRFIVPDNDKLAAGDYEFLVVGRKAIDHYALPTPVAGRTKIGDMTASVTAPGNESEIFAGLQATTITSEGVRVRMEMTRKVAGVMGYFKNVPAILNHTPVKYLRLIVSSAGTKVELANGNGIDPVGTAYSIIDEDLSGQAVTAEGVYSGNDLTARGIVKLANSQLFGKFVLPVGSVTMILGLYDADNNPLKTWTVVDGASSTLSLTTDRVYSLGRKICQNDTTGGYIRESGEDDFAVDLLKEQVITLATDSNWNTLHYLVIQ